MDQQFNGKAGYATFVHAMKEIGWTSLHCMVEKEDTSSIKELLCQGANINAVDTYNRTPLSIAASKGNLQLVELLLNKGAGPNVGFPLYYACDKGHSTVVSHLIKNGAQVNLEREKNYPLLLAARKGHLETCKILVEHNADLSVINECKQTVLHCACDSGNLALIAFLIDAGCKIDALDKDNEPPFLKALIRKDEDPDVVKFLLKKGVSPHRIDDQGNTYLHIAETPEATRELIKYGVDVNIQNNNKETALFNITMYRSFECGKVLLENNADPNIPNKGGWTVLHFAASEGNLDYVETLLKHKVDVNCVSSQNVIPLYLAACSGHLEVVKTLLEAGSLVDVPYIDVPDINNESPYFEDKYDPIKDGYTPFAIAAYADQMQICTLLASYGANWDCMSTMGLEFTPPETRASKMNDWPCNNILRSVISNKLDAIKNIKDIATLDVSDEMGWSPLHYAAYKGFYKMCCELIKKGLSVNALDKYQRTPLSVAAAKNELKILNLLLDNRADVNLGLALHHAIQRESSECIEELIKRNCDTNIKDESEARNTPLIRAASKLDLNTIEMLLKYEADPNLCNEWKQTPLHHCCQTGYAEAAEVLIKHGADINAALLVSAFQSDNSEVIELILKNHVGIYEKTLLHHAVYYKIESAVNELLAVGVSVNEANNDGETPLFSATRNLPILRSLIQNKADVNCRAPDGWTPLHNCAKNGSLDTLRELLKHNANVNSASAEFVLPIYLASTEGHYDCAKELLDHGSFVDPYIFDIGTFKNDSKGFPRYHIVPGNTPMIGAASKGHSEVVELLLSRGASLNAVNCKGNSALHEAILQGRNKVVEFLLTAGIDVNLRNVDGKTGFEMPKEEVDDEMMKLMFADI